MWSIDVSDAGTDVKGAILDRLYELDEGDERTALDEYPGTDLPALAEYIDDTHAYRGTFDDDDLDDAIDAATGAYIGGDLHDYCHDIITETEPDGSLAVQYAGAIARQMAYDMQCGGEVCEYGGVWFRSF